MDVLTVHNSPLARTGLLACALGGILLVGASHAQAVELDHKELNLARSVTSATTSPAKRVMPKQLAQVSERRGIGGRQRLSPKIRSQSLHGSGGIDSASLEVFMRASSLADLQQLNKSAYVVEGSDGQILLGARSQFYARGRLAAANRYQLVRPGRLVRDPSSGQVYGTELVSLGSARLLKPASGEGAMALLEVEQASQEIRPGDRLLAARAEQPMAALTPVRVQHPINAQVVMIPQGVDEAGQYDVITINAGAQAQLKAGHVLAVGTEGGVSTDPLSGEVLDLPRQQRGEVMVFKVLPLISYGVLMNTRNAVKVGDAVFTP